MTFRPVQFRPLSSRVLAVLVTAVCAFALVAIVLQSNTEFIVRSVGPIAFLAVLSIAAFWLPKIDMREDEIGLRNVFSTSHIRWGAIRSVENRWSLTLVTDRGKATAWASPGPPRSPEVGSFLRSMTVPGAVATPASAIPAKDNIALQIQAHWDTLADQGRLDPVGAGTGPSRRLNLITIAILAVLLTAAVLGIVL